MVACGAAETETLKRGCDDRSGRGTEKRYGLYNHICRWQIRDMVTYVLVVPGMIKGSDLRSQDISFSLCCVDSGMSAPELSGPDRHVTRRDHSPHAHVVRANATPAPGLIVKANV
jgi:hypothetical protein